ncbi:MAG: Hpt domain-containing protein [Anaerolineales bacterium]|jgi:HPt (histidine-containing phosphotransfer) domain-containing protein
MGQLITDHTALDQYLDVMGEEANEFIIEVIDAFLVDTPNKFSQLDSSLAENDAETFCRAAHTLKTSYKTVGAMDLAESCLELEKMSESGDLSSVDSLLSDCKSKFDQLKSELIEKKEAFM